MKQILIILAITATMVFAQTTRTIDVTGKCSLSVNPDIIYFYVDIETIDESLSGTKKKNDRIFFDLVNSLVKSGVTKENIRLNRIQYNKHQVYEGGKYVHKGYIAKQNLQVELRKLDLFEKILLDLIQNSDIKFQTEFDTTKAASKKQEALVDALQKAKEKAERMAAVYGMTVGGVLKINEFAPVHTHRANVYEADTRSRSNMFSQIEISASVAVQFELLPKK